MSHHSYLPAVLLTVFAYTIIAMAMMGLKVPWGIARAHASYYTFIVARTYYESSQFSFIWAFVTCCLFAGFLFAP